MSLYHFDYKKEILPKNVLKNEYIQVLVSRVPKVTFEKMVRILSEQVADQKPSKASALTFAKLATLVGHSSTCPTRDSNYVWDKVTEAARQHPKTANLMLGALAQYCFALDDREWLAAKDYTGKLNEDVLLGETSNRNNSEATEDEGLHTRRSPNEVGTGSRLTVQNATQQ